MKDSYLFTAGALFFAVWAAILVALNCAEFARDLFPSRSLSGPTPNHSGTSKS